ncbi:MAG TPA: hypothetical protein PLC59_07845 [Bacteroidales bacterium]|nr:hypothetical protein [Bacteroidales bacterium]
MKHLKIKKPQTYLIGLNVIALISILFIASCFDKRDFAFDKIAAFQWEPNLAAPIIKSTLTMKDLISNADTNVLVEDASNFLSIVYKASVFSERADEIISIENQNFNSAWTFATGTITDSATFSYFINTNFTAPNGERFDSIYVKSGSLQFNLNGNLNHNGKLRIIIPYAKKNGIPFRRTIMYNYNNSLPVITNNTFDLSGYTFSFGTDNKLNINFSITVYADANPNNSPYTLNLNEAFQDIKFHKIFGYVGKRSFSINQDSVDFDIYQNNIDGSIQLEDPKLNIYIRNAYGMPINVNFTKLDAKSSVNPPYIVPITGSGLPNPLLIQAPTFAQIGQSILTKISLSKTNSTIVQAVNMSPNYLDFLVEALSNPNGNPATDQNFVIDSSKFEVDIEAELPLYGSASGFKLQDTVDFDLGEDIEEVEWVILKVFTSNGFPIDVSMQIYFADSLGNKLDSLLTSIDQIISSGIVGPAPSYKVITPTEKHLSIQINQQKMDNLLKAEKLIILANLSTTNNGVDKVKIYSDYEIDVKLGVQAKGKISANPNKQ